MDKKENPLGKIIKRAGSQEKLAERINAIKPPERKPVTQTHVSYWLRSGVPVAWVDLVSAAGGGVVSPEKLAQWKMQNKLESRFKRK